MNSSDGRNIRPGLGQIGEVEPGNLVQFFENGKVEDAGVSVESLQKQIDELRERIDAISIPPEVEAKPRRKVG